MCAADFLRLKLWKCHELRLRDSQTDLLCRRMLVRLMQIVWVERTELNGDGHSHTATVWGCPGPGASPVPGACLHHSNCGTVPFRTLIHNMHDNPNA